MTTDPELLAKQEEEDRAAQSQPCGDAGAPQPRAATKRDPYAASLSVSERAALFVNEVLECAAIGFGLSATELQDVAQRWGVLDDPDFTRFWSNAWAARCDNYMAQIMGERGQGPRVRAGSEGEAEAPGGPK